MEEMALMLVVFGVSFGIGYMLISKVPPLLHTPLMSMTNAISAVTILGAILVFTETPKWIAIIIGSAALVTASFNLVGGFIVTDRMAKMFKTHHDDDVRS